MPISTYSTGTVAIAANATAVVGTGPNWSGQNAMSGDLLVVEGQTVIIQDVTDATHLAIDAWPFGAVSAGATYKIYQVSPLRFVGSQAMLSVNQLVAALNTNGFYVFVGPDATVPDPSLGQDQQYAFQATTGKQWQKVGGIWNFIGVFKGFGAAAPWSSSTAYVPQDVVSLDGTSYVCIQANTNEEPTAGDSPPNAFWTVLAAKGDTGDKGDAATIEVGTVTSLPSSSEPTVENVGTSSAAVFNFGIPKGEDGTGTGDMKGADNLSDVADPTTALANLGGMAKSANLSDITNPATARGNLGAAARTRTRTVLTSGSGTYTTPSGCVAINVRMIGGGGGGGGSLTSGSAGTGSAGGTTSFGTSLLTASGGGGGGTAGIGAGGGAATGGDINIQGGSGDSGLGAGAGNVTPYNTGRGGSGVFGGSGGEVFPGHAGGSAADNSGGGGSGALPSSSGQGGAGGGAGGYCEKLISSPAATYSYAVGVGGAAGGAGSEGSVGGNGGSGVIIVDEFY